MPAEMQQASIHSQAEGGGRMLAYSLEHICSYSAQLQNPPEVIGPVPEGIRVNFYVTSGAVTGPRFEVSFVLSAGTGSPFAPMVSGSLMSARRLKLTIMPLSTLPIPVWGTLGRTATRNFFRASYPARCRYAWCRVSTRRIPRTSGSIACNV